MRARIAGLLLLLAMSDATNAQLPGGGGGSNAGAANFNTSQATVTNVATLIVAARPGRIAVTIEQLGFTQVYIGNAGVTTGTGIPLLGTPGTSITLSVTGALYGIVSTGSQTVSVVETY